ncbi:hypothetical protein L873DRAFT_177560 [Choiromyces venosus 120613-1]|uniref:Uncharacterized protein n=1 Tax=Choiromyces venosus 120613-1 TaxID=1336337 RepID=A0A3N4JYZ0_9PEZI|nr:hypothetical protein L873DRAFT_177560 [Choiromyces venosus 120613-1]
MVELAIHWDQSSTDPETQKLVQEKAVQLELDGKRVREDSLQGLVHCREEEGSNDRGGDRSGTGTTGPAKKIQKNQTAKNIDNVLLSFVEGIEKDKEELKEIERKQDQKHEDLKQSILRLMEEIREQSERRSQDAYLKGEARKNELVLILEVLRKDGEI